VRLRDATWRDIPELARLDRELFGGDAWSEPTWWAELAARPRRDYVVTVGGTPAVVAGYAGLDLVGSVADVMTLGVALEWQRRGLGDRLVTELVGRARARGAESLMLEVRARNAEAIALYERHGFSQVAVRPAYYQPDGVDALVMRRGVDGS